MKKTFGKILGAFLCLGMVLGLMPTQALQVKAADEHKHCVCGATHRDVGDHTSETEIMFQAWKKTDSLPDTAGNYYLENDVVLNVPTDTSDMYRGWQVPDGVVLCLNGHSITATGRNLSNDIFVQSNTTFTMTDCKNTGRVTHAKNADGITYTGSAINVSGGTFKMYGGSITGNDATSNNPSDGRNCGGGVYLSGTFKMYGGSITNNHSASDGGGVYIPKQWDCYFYMYGGNITDNTTGKEGGGVYAVSDMTVSGNANITGNKKADGSVSNVGLYTTNSGKTKTIKIAGDMNGTIGVYTDRVVPTAENPVVVVQGATANKDYSNFITSDSANYKIMHDSSDPTKLVLTGKDAPEPTPTEHKWGKEYYDPDYRDNNRINSHKTGTAPCKTACPAHIAVQGYLKKAAQGEYTEALALIKKQNPFPAVCGRICNRRCEDACTRGTIDEPIAIDAVKRFIAERDLHADTRYVPPIVVPASIHKNGWEEKIAIIGGGPAGLSCAFYLAERGYKPTVFEKNENAGGMLRYGIPSYKLEKDVIEAEIDIMREMGVEIKTGVEVGKDISLDELRAQGYKAFYIAIGCSAGRRPGVPGDDAEGTFTAIDYLKNANCGGADYNGRVVVVGGGNVAIDAARVSARNGASEVTQLCLESEKEMPASDEEVREAGEDGVTIKCGWGPKEVLVTDGKVSGIIFKKCVSVFEEVDGRKKFAPKYDESETITIDCDRVIFAVGQQSVWGDLLKSEDVEFRGPALVADGLTYQVQGAPDLFIGGDVMTGPKFAIDAIAAGHWASESLHRYVQNGHMTIGRNKWEFIELNKDDILVESYDNSSRQSEGFDETLGNKSFKDAHIALTEEQVKIETSRCLGCGATIVDANKCIGCGVCTTKCAFDAITLHRDHPECSTMVTAEDKFKAIIPYELKRAVKIVFAPKTAEEKAAIKAHKEAMQNK